MKYAIAIAVLIASQSPLMSQQRTPPPIPAAGDSEQKKVEICKESISGEIGWQLGAAKRLRDWCRDNGYITYQQQLEAEKIVK
ncbi:hypothetical protein [Agrobacterium tumefaciens]|uniref:hypothetical protein n=1 Tax=Agrobacterium tumefaciens TaxID=358 RepID=UPI0021D1FF23|nr:hypothetical protein [Agrobacterium tumefaciens]UXT96765.1 hypothetical protein FY129_04530 [Agrobacterium tumefaciens]